MRQRTGILGGTFNPPHNGHLEMAKRAKELLSLQRVLFIPAKTPPHKTMPARSPSAQDRLAMLRLAVSALPFAEVSDIELTRPGKSYTADTLKLLKMKYPEDVFYLLLGSDMLYTFQNWHKPDAIASMCEIAAFPRIKDEIPQMRRHAETLRNVFKTEIHVIAAPAVEVSSTDVRQLLENKKPEGRIPEEVYDYIVRNGLYTEAL